MFSPSGPRPWHTKPGESRLDKLVEQAREKLYTVDDINAGRAGSIAASTGAEKTATTTENIEKV